MLLSFPEVVVNMEAIYNQLILEIHDVGPRPS